MRNVIVVALIISLVVVPVAFLLLFLISVVFILFHRIPFFALLLPGLFRVVSFLVCASLVHQFEYRWIDPGAVRVLSFLFFFLGKIRLLIFTCNDSVIHNERVIHFAEFLDLGALLA